MENQKYWKNLTLNFYINLLALSLMINITVQAKYFPGRIRNMSYKKPQENSGIDHKILLDEYEQKK